LKIETCSLFYAQKVEIFLNMCSQFCQDDNFCSPFCQGDNFCSSILSGGQSYCIFNKCYSQVLKIATCSLFYAQIAELFLNMCSQFCQDDNFCSPFYQGDNVCSQFCQGDNALLWLKFHS
jgi:hypothetical protein